MSVPGFQTFMLPLLELLKDGKEHALDEGYRVLSEQFSLSEEDKRELLPSGKQEIYKNRIGWAKAYLKKAGLVESPARGKIEITEKGRQVLGRDLREINISFLTQYAEFNEFYTAKSKDQPQNIDSDNQTPNEVIDNAYQLIRKSLAQDLLMRIMDKTPDFFERVVIELLVKMGYGGNVAEAGKAIGRTGDEGIDGIIKEDKLGLDIIYVQAKRWKSGNTVGRPEIQKFVGALAGQGAKKGIFITTSGFTKEAKEFQPKTDIKVVLIDGEYLTELMIDYDIGVAKDVEYEIKKIDSDYFDEE